MAGEIHVKGTGSRPADRHELVNRGAGGGFFRPMPDAEIAARTHVIRAVKRAANGIDLTDDELDRLFEPINNRRTRLRLLGRS